MNRVDPSGKELRKFAATMTIALGVIGGLVLWRKGEAGFILLGLALLLLLFSWIRPVFLVPFHKMWMTLSLILGFISSHLVLALLYYLVFFPIGLTLRLSGKDPLSLKTDATTESYWLQRKPRDSDKNRYEKMF